MDDQTHLDSEEITHPSELPRKRRRKRRSAPTDIQIPQRPKWEVISLLVLISGVCFLGGGRSVFIKGVAIASIGLITLLRPPNFRPTIALKWTLFLSALCPLFAFLPLSFLGGDPSWRNALQEDFGMPMSWLGTAQPWLTFESWIYFVCGLYWLAFCTLRGTTTSDRRLAMRVLAATAGIVSVLAILMKSELISIPWWKYPEEMGGTIGPFANRNHTSSLMVLGSLFSLAAAYDAYRRKEKVWGFFVLCLLPMGTVIVTNTSRAGVILYILGIILWLWTASLRKGFTIKIALTATFGLAALSSLVLFGSKVLPRLIGGDEGASPARSVMTRLSLYKDSIDITSKSPWTGIGLGNFKDEFAMLSSTPGPLYRFTHPESDWVWLLVEGGMLLFISVFALIGVLSIMTGPWRMVDEDDRSKRQDRRLRNSFALAALIAAIHGLFDVPNHSPGYAIISAFALGLAIRSEKISAEGTFWSKTLHRTCGLLMIGVGVLFSSTALGNALIPGSAYARVLASKAMDLSSNDRDSEALKLTSEAIRVNPLNWSLYFQRAQIRLRLNESEQMAYRDFSIARSLEPHVARICLVEGEIWAPINASFAIAAWKEALRRSPNEAIGMYHIMTDMVTVNPELTVGLAKLAYSPSLKLTFLGKAVLYEGHSPQMFDHALSDFLANPTNLEFLDSKSRQLFFRLWYRHGNKSTLLDSLERNLAWQRDGWMILAEEYSKSGKYESAYNLCLRFESPPINPTASGIAPLVQLEQSFLFNPTDIIKGLDLYFAYKSKGDWGPALATLEKIAVLPGAPAYLNYEMAIVHAEKGDFRRAWELMHQYLNRPK